MKNIRFGRKSVVLVCAVFCLSFLSRESVAQVVLDKVVAVVNSQVITQGQVNQEMKIERAQLSSSGQAVPSEGLLRQRVLNQLIDEALQLDVAKKAHMTVTDAQVSEAIRNIAAQNQISSGELLSSVAHQGISEKTYREQIRKQILIHQVQQKMVASQVNLSKDDVANAASQASGSVSSRTVEVNAQTKFHVVDMLFATDSQAQEGRNKLQVKRREIKKLDDVNAILKQSGQAVVSVSDLGVRTLADYPTVLSGTIKSMRPGEFSSPVKAPNGYHVLLLVGSTAHYRASTPALTPEQKAFQVKFDQVLKTWLQKLRNQSYVKIIND